MYSLVMRKATHTKRKSKTHFEQVSLNVVKKIASDGVSRTKRTGPKNVTPLTRSVRIV
jgi:hypothetical protein